MIGGKKRRKSFQNIVYWVLTNNTLFFSCICNVCMASLCTGFDIGCKDHTQVSFYSTSLNEFQEDLNLLFVLQDRAKSIGGDSDLEMELDSLFILHLEPQDSC